MRKMLFLAAAAALSLACHNRSDEEVGAAPDQGRTGDTTAVTHAIDSTRTGPPGVSGRPGDATVTADSVGIDTAVTRGADSTAVGQDTSMTSIPQDTLGPGNPLDTGVDTTATPGDTTGFRSDTTMSDTTSTNQ